MNAWISGLVVTAVATTMLGCASKTPTASVVIEDKVYAVTPAMVTVRAGILTGEMGEMKVTERVEQGTGRIDSPAKLTGTLKLKNGSVDQIVRMVGGKVLYIDNEGNPIKMERTRTEPTIRFSSSELDPGKDLTQTFDFDFPAEALKAKKLKEIRLELSYVPSPYRQETAKLVVSIGG